MIENVIHMYVVPISNNNELRNFARSYFLLFPLNSCLKKNNKNANKKIKQFNSIFLFPEKNSDTI